MPRYKVKEKGFYEGKLYDPNGKRPFVHTDKPIKKVPLWLEAVKAETTVERKKRIAAEKKQSVTDKKKAASDRKAIDELNFMGTGEKSNTVETL